MRRPSILPPLLVCHALAVGTVAAQTSPAFGPLPEGSAPSSAGEMPLGDYLGLLRQISPAAESGARTYLAGVRLRCGLTLSTGQLRQAMAEGEGNPALMGLIRAEHHNDLQARDRLVAQIACPGGVPR